jgi:hypothetical protein
MSPRLPVPDAVRVLQLSRLSDATGDIPVNDELVCAFAALNTDPD